MSLSHEVNSLVNCVRNKNFKMFEMVLDRVYKGGSVSSTLHNHIIKAEDISPEEKIVFLDVLDNIVKEKSADYEHGWFIDDVLLNAIKRNKLDIECDKSDGLEIFKHFVNKISFNVSSKVINSLTKNNLIEWLEIVESFKGA